MHRGDDCGSARILDDFLRKVSPEWRSKVTGSHATIFPAGNAANGNDGVVEQVRAAPGSIGWFDWTRFTQASARCTAGRWKEDWYRRILGAGRVQGMALHPEMRTEVAARARARARACERVGGTWSG